MLPSPPRKNGQRSDHNGIEGPGLKKQYATHKRSLGRKCNHKLLAGEHVESVAFGQQGIQP
jgi:hypothetical protein